MSGWVSDLGEDDHVEVNELAQSLCHTHGANQNKDHRGDLLVVSTWLRSECGWCIEGGELLGVDFIQFNFKILKYRFSRFEIVKGAGMRYIQQNFYL